MQVIFIDRVPYSQETHVPVLVSLLCLFPAVVAHLVNGMVVGGENVHRTENATPLVGIGKQSLHQVVECLAIFLCQKSPCLIFLDMSNLLPLLQAEI